MPEINYKTLETHLKRPEGIEPVILLYGDEYLYKAALETLLEHLLPGAARKTAYEPATDDNVTDALEGLFTLSFFSKKKVVHLADSRLFYSKDDAAKILSMAKEEADNDAMDKAAELFLKYLAHAGLSMEELTPGRRESIFKEDAEWVGAVIDHCKESNLFPKKGADLTSLLEETVNRSFPKGNHLVITTDLADKRRSLFKTLSEKGLVVDCSVPKGDRKADKDEQESVLKERVHAILEPHGKTINPDAYHRMTELIGFDLRTFTANLEKLVSYSGDGNIITADDVDAVVERTRTDPVYELTNAVMERNIEKALLCIESLMAEEVHPLQALAALVNQMRRLMVVKGFMDSTPEAAAVFSMPFPRFKTALMPLVTAFDDNNRNWSQEWDDAVSKKEKGKKKKSTTDIAVAKNKNSPYPVYLALRNSDKYTMEELCDALVILGEADILMKSTSKSPRLLIEDALLRIFARRKP